MSKLPTNLFPFTLIEAALKLYERRRLLQQKTSKQKTVMPAYPIAVNWPCLGVFLPNCCFEGKGHEDLSKFGWTMAGSLAIGFRKDLMLPKDNHSQSQRVRFLSMYCCSIASGLNISSQTKHPVAYPTVCWKTKVINKDHKKQCVRYRFDLI